MSSRLTEIQNKKSESKETLQTLSRRYHLQTKSVANENNNDTNRSNSDDICLLRTLKNKLTQQQRDELKQNSEETVKCINEAIQHGKISCNVCGRHELLAVIGCYHFEMFRKKYEKFQAIIALEDQRMRAKRKADKEPDKDQPKRVPTDDERLFRRFNIESYPTLTNTRQLDKLLEFAKKSVDTFQKCSECLIEFTPKFLCQVNVLDVLRSLVFVFEAYGDLVYQHKAGSFYKALVVTTGIRIGTHRFYAYYCMLRVHLSVGLVDDASAYLKSAKAQLAPANLNENEGKTLKLAEIEIKLLCNEDLPAIANELKQLIESFRSIETLTITQTYLKCSALHLATRFHPRDFDFDANFEEFIVSMQSMMNLMRVYHPYLMDKKSDFKVVNTSLQSIWLRFANYRLLFQVFTTHNLFYKNMCLYPEHQVYYFNLTLALARLNCMTFWVVHILVRTSLQESLLLQKEKLLNAYLVLGGNTKVFQRKWMHLDVKSCNQSVDKTTKILSDSPLRYANKQYADDDDDERDEGISSNYEDIPFAQQRLFMKVRPETEVDVDESTFKIVVLERDLEKLDDCNLIDLILLRFELIHYLNASENQGPQLTNYFRSSDLNQQLKLHSQRVSKVFGVRGAKLKPLHPNLFSTATQLYFRKFQLDHLDGTAESFEFVEQIVFESGRFCKSYEMHCLIRYFVQKYIEMYGERHSLFYDELLTFDLAAIEQKMNAFNLQKVTPASPPTGRKTRRLQAMAPKKSIRYQMDELKEYVEDLYRTDRMGISGRKTTPEVLIIDSSSDDDDVVLITKPQPLTAKKNHKSICRTTRSQSHLTVKKEVDENDDESNENRSNNILTVVEKKTRPKCRIELSPQKNESIEDCLILFDKLNLDNDSNDSDTPLFKRKTNEQTHEKFLRQMLRDLLALFAFSPPIDLHLFMSSILFRMHLTSKRSDDNVAQSAYHFTEMVTGNSLRYQTIRTHQNRSTVGIQSFDTKHLKFECEEKVFDGQLTQLMRSLPSGWRAIQIQQILKPNQTIPDLYVCRVEPDVKPIMIKIKANPTKFTRNFLDELHEVINLNASTNRETDLAAYWKYRFALDKRFETLLQMVETVWFGPFIGLFMGKCNDPYFYTVADKFCQHCFDSFASNLQLEEQSHVLVMLKLICESFPLLDRDKFVQAMVCLFERYDARFDSWYEKGQSLFADYYRRREISEHDFGDRIKFGPVGIILSASLQQFPFESMPALKKIKQDMFRTPSLRHLVWMYNNHRKLTRNFSHGFNDDSTLYLVDAGSNLPRTNEYFREKIDKMVAQHGWTGYYGSEPNPTTFEKQLESHHLYIYFGHNSGKEFYTNLERTNLKCLAIVIGCSSGKVFPHANPLHVTGTAYQFLISGCVSYVGCLWQVTDRDIDRFADRFMNHISHNWDEQHEHFKAKNVCQAINLSRDICKMKYLNGAATVSYGLPAFFKKYVTDKQNKKVRNDQSST